MKIKVTILAENNESVECLGESPEKRAKEAWDAIAEIINCTIENVQIVYDQGDIRNWCQMCISKDYQYDEDEVEACQECKKEFDKCWKECGRDSMPVHFTSK